MLRTSTSAPAIHIKGPIGAAAIGTLLNNNRAFETPTIPLPPCAWSARVRRFWDSIFVSPAGSKPATRKTGRAAFVLISQKMLNPKAGHGLIA